jgi:hypothetical protein
MPQNMLPIVASLIILGILSVLGTAQVLPVSTSSGGKDTYLIQVPIPKSSEGDNLKSPLTFVIQLLMGNSKGATDNNPTPQNNFPSQAEPWRSQPIRNSWSSLQYRKPSISNTNSLPSQMQPNIRFQDQNQNNRFPESMSGVYPVDSCFSPRRIVRLKNGTTACLLVRG